MSIGGRHHRRLSSLDSTTRRLRLSDDASSSPSSADLERSLPKRAATERSSSRLASSSQASSTQPSALFSYLCLIMLSTCESKDGSSPLQRGGCRNMNSSAGHVLHFPFGQKAFGLGMVILIGSISD